MARARLAFITAGQPALGAPRRAAIDGVPERSPDGDLPSDDEPQTVVPGQTLGRRIHNRLFLTTKQAVAVLALLLCGVVVTLTALGRSSASQLPIEPSPVVSTAVTVAHPTVSPSPPTLMRVHVLGAVVSPGVVSVTGGAIVQDALAAAGGLRDDADPAELNLAAPVSEGQQVIVGTTGEPRGQVNQQPVPTSVGVGGALVNLNTADRAELEGLPGVGPVLAEAIIAWREENDGFGSPSELQEVSGIGPKSYAKLEPLVTT